MPSSPRSPRILANKYTLNKVIATGSYGKVYNCYPYAVKQLKLPNSSQDHPNLCRHIKQTLDNEINILRDINHDNIVKLYEIIYEENPKDGGNVYLVMEHCQSDLKKQTFGKAQGASKALAIMAQIIKGCKEMYNLNIVHRDIKPANILCNQSVYKLADFGMAKYLEQTREQGQESMLKSHVGTPYYMAPQILQRKHYTKKCDIWSLGVIFYELIYGMLPWDGKDQKALLHNIHSHKLKFHSNIKIPADIKSVVQKMLTINQQKRASWDQLFVMFEMLLQSGGNSSIPSSTTIASNKNIKQRPTSTTEFGVGSPTNSPVSFSVHRSVIQKMIQIERQRISIFEFKFRYVRLNSEQKLYVQKILQSLFDHEYLHIIQEFEQENNQQQPQQPQQSQQTDRSSRANSIAQPRKKKSFQHITQQDFRF